TRRAEHLHERLLDQVLGGGPLPRQGDGVGEDRGVARRRELLVEALPARHVAPSTARCCGPPSCLLRTGSARGLWRVREGPQVAGHGRGWVRAWVWGEGRPGGRGAKGAEAAVGRRTRGTSATPRRTGGAAASCR